MGDDHLIREELDVLQSDLDDESPEIVAYVIDLLLKDGALDAHQSPIMMKKGRQGTRIEVLCKPDDRERFITLLLKETSTLGVKANRIERYSLPREIKIVEVRGEKIRIKVSRLDGDVLKAKPEFEDCRKAAEKLGIALKQIVEEAKAAWGVEGKGYS